MTVRSDPAHARRRAALAALVVAGLAVAACGPRESSTVETESKAVRFGTAEKICQLTGEHDWETGRPTTTSTASAGGLVGTDLGYPVEHAGRLALLFGDTRPRIAAGITVPPDDAVGWITSRTPPTAERCTDLQINHIVLRNLPGRPRVVQPPVVTEPAHIQQGLFNVPTGGVSDGGWLYAFFWTDHCTDNAPCPESADLNSVGRGVLARSRDDGRTFVDAVALPFRFVYATAVDAVAIPELPAEQRLGTYVFAVPEYRKSVPYLAYAPPGALGTPAAWRFFVGRAADGTPQWTTSEVWHLLRAKPGPPGAPELFAGGDGQRCVGELSVTWNHRLGVWLMLYNCAAAGRPQRILARVADAPWGPWSAAAHVLAPYEPGVPCRLLMTLGGCDDRPSEQADKEIDGGVQRAVGWLYAPFVMERFTTNVPTLRPGARAAMVYWLLSTWNPYQVVVMRTTLEATETRAPLVKR